MIFGYSILSLGLSAGLAEVRPDFQLEQEATKRDGVSLDGRGKMSPPQTNATPRMISLKQIARSPGCAAPSKSRGDRFRNQCSSATA
jgi:hypothetical protein